MFRRGAGECLIKSEEAKKTLTEFLALSVTSELSGSPDVSSQSSYEYQPHTEQDTTEEQVGILQSDRTIDCSDPDISIADQDNITQSCQTWKVQWTI